MSDEDRKHFETLLNIHKRNLKILEQQAARFGDMAPMHILSQLDDTKAKIADLEAQLGISKAGLDTRQTSAIAPTPPAAAEALTLTLRIVPRGNAASIMWEAPEIGLRTSRFAPPYDASTLPLVIKALDAAQSPAKKQALKLSQTEREQLTKLGLWQADHAAANIDRIVGRALYKALIADPEGRIALESMLSNAVSRGAQLTYLLRFPPEAIELAALPWELLWSEANPLILSQDRLAPMIRYLDLEQALPPALSRTKTLRILAVAPNAKVPLKIRAEEHSARNSAWAQLADTGTVALEELSPATVSALVDRIQDAPTIDILHFFGHGRYKNGLGELLFDTPNGDGIWVGADRLAALLGGTRLVMLHACKSATAGEEGLFTGVAPALTYAGVPAVVAMQFSIRMSAATRFAEIVYRDLAKGRSIQEAVGRARQALYVESNDGANWYVPTLMIRSRDTGPMRLVEQQ